MRSEKKSYLLKDSNDVPRRGTREECEKWVEANSPDDYFEFSVVFIGAILAKRGVV